MSRIHAAFEHGKAFIPFITAGDPDMETTYETVLAAAENGADLIEIGIPFSDPTAEGPVIQNANIRSLTGGFTTERAFELVSELRKKISIPLVFMTYANVVYSNGTERFAEKSALAGVDGMILPDVPFEEKEEFEKPFAEKGLDLISLVAPTSKDRLATIAKEAKGFIYVVSSLGVTGVRSNITTDISAMTRVIKDNTEVPCAVGFGISTPEQAVKMAQHADGVIVGSAIVKIIGQNGIKAPAPVGEYVKSVKEALARAY